MDPQTHSGQDGIEQSDTVASSDDIKFLLYSFGF